MPDTSLIPGQMDALSKPMGFQFVSLAELTKEQIQVLKDSVAKDTTDTELTYFLNVALTQSLDPFRKEVWAIKYNGKLTVQTGRDGFLKIAKRDPTFDRIQSAEIREGDEFRMDLTTGQVEHRITSKRGQILGAWATITRKDGVKLTKYVTFSEYNDPSSNMWKDYPTAMVTKCVESVLCKQFANVSGIVAEETMRRDGTVIDSSPTAQAQASTLADDLVRQIEACTDFEEFAKLRDTVAGIAGKLFGEEKEKVFAAAKKKKAALEAAELRPTRPDMTDQVINHQDGKPTNTEVSNLEISDRPAKPRTIAKMKLDEVALHEDGTVGVGISDVQYAAEPQPAQEMAAEDFASWVEGMRAQESQSGVDDVFKAATEKPLSPDQRAQLEQLREECKKQMEPKKAGKKSSPRTA